MQGATQSTPTAPLSRGIQPATSPDYASREAKAKGLEKFEGGSTTVVLVAGGSTLLVILIVVLIIVLI